MRTTTACLVLLLAVGASAEEPKPPPAVLAGAWAERAEDGTRLVVVALHLRPGAPAQSVHVAHGEPSDDDEPGGYGVFPAAGWREARVEPGEVLLLRRRTTRDAVPVLVAEKPAKGDVDVHHLIDGGAPAGTWLFTTVHDLGGVTLDRHLAFVGDRVEATVAPPGDEGFFRPETFETVRVPRHLPLDGDDPDGPAGFLTVTPREGPAFRVLEGEAGERRIRAHFTNPRCPWAERHVKWMTDLWILEYLEPAPLVLVLDTSSAKGAARASDLWRGWGAFSVESIWPNGFGGSSSNLDLPALLVLPRETRVRTVDG